MNGFDHLDLCGGNKEKTEIVNEFKRAKILVIVRLLFRGFVVFALYALCSPSAVRCFRQSSAAMCGRNFQTVEVELDKRGLRAIIGGLSGL